MSLLDQIKATVNKVFNKKQTIDPQLSQMARARLNQEFTQYKPTPQPNIAPKATNLTQEFQSWSNPVSSVGSWLDGIIKDYKAKPANQLFNQGISAGTQLFNKGRSALDLASNSINGIPVVGSLYKDIIYNNESKRLFPGSSMYPENNPTTNLYSSIKKYGTWQAIPREEKKVLLADMQNKSENLIMGMTGGINTTGKFRAGVRSAVNESPAYARTKLNTLLGKTSTVADDSKPLIDSLRETTPPPQGFTHSLEEMYKMSGKDVKSKVSIIDYLRTPERVLDKMGLGKEAKYLRQQWDAYQSQLPQEIEKIKNWSVGIDEQANKRIFQKLDGKSVQLQSPRELQIVMEVQDYLSQWADKLKLPKQSRIGNYITHLFDDQITKKEFDSDFAKLIKDEIPGSVYDPFLQRRTQNKLQYKEDFVKSLEAYAKRALRKYQLDPALAKIKAVAPNLEESQYRYVKSYIERINLRPTQIDSMIDNFVKSIPIGYKLGQRPTNLVTSKARQAVSRGLLGLSPITALKNLIQGTNTYSQLGEKFTLIGYGKMAKNLPKILKGEKTELEAVGVLQDSFLQDKSLSATKKLWDKIDEGLWYLFQKAEAINRGSAFWGAKAKGISQGMTETEAVEYAKALVRKTQYSFGNIDSPAILQSDIMKTWGQFMGYGIKQFEFIGDMIGKKDLAGLIRYIGSTYLLSSVLGINPVESIVPSVRVGLPPTLTLPYGVAKGILNDKNQYGQKIGWGERLWNSDVQKGLVSYFPAGNQIRRTLEGIRANTDKGSYTETGKLRYPVQPSIKNAIFGTKTSPEAEQYYTQGNELSDKQTELYKSLLSNGMSPQQAYQTIDAKRQADKANTDRLSAYTQTPSLLDSLKDKVLGVKSPVPGFTSNGTAPDSDPLLQALQNNESDSNNTSFIKQLFGLGLPSTQIKSILESQGIDYDEAKYTMIKSLQVENGARPDYLKTLLSGKNSDEYVQTVKTLTEEKLLTSSVVSYWLENNEISDSQAKSLNQLIKQLKAIKTGKTTAKKLKTPPKIRVSIPSVKSSKIEAPKLKIKSYADYQPIQTKMKPLSLPTL